MTLFNVNFESPVYTTGEVYSAATNTGTLPRTGPAPSVLTKLDGSGANWTATVGAGPTGNRLTFANTTSGVFTGTLEAFAPPSSGGTTGTWFAQLDYTRLTSAGGPLFAMRLVNNSGSAMLGHSNNNLLYADWWSGSPGVNMTVGVTNTLRLEIDMGTNVWRTYANGILMNTNTNASNDTGANGFGGLQLGFFGSTYAAGNIFALDNIQIGSIPEPATPALLGLGLCALVISRKRKA